MGLQRRLIAALAALAVATTLAACGEDDFENNPRAPAPISLTARIGDTGISLGPQEIGAGIVDVTISNQTDEPARLVFEGPTDDSTDTIVAGGTGTAKLALEEGDYEVSNGEGTDNGAAQLKVGPERETSQNDLLLP